MVSKNKEILETWQNNAVKGIKQMIIPKTRYRSQISSRRPLIAHGHFHSTCSASGLSASRLRGCRIDLVIGLCTHYLTEMLILSFHRVVSSVALLITQSTQMINEGLCTLVAGMDCSNVHHES